MAHGVAGAQTGTSPEAAALRMTPGNGRLVCAHYDAERAAYTATVAVLEPAAGDAATSPPEGAAYRLLVLAMHEDAARAAARAPALTGDEALALLGIAEAEHREGRAARDEYRGRLARERNRLRFTGGDGRAMPRTMTVFTTPGLAIVESGARGRSARGDGPYRCARAPEPRALLPAHCAEARAGRVDLGAFPAPRAEVRLIQRALEKSGINPGPIDGIFGPLTLGALERWHARTRQGQGRIVTYETLCGLIEAPRAGTAP